MWKYMLKYFFPLPQLMDFINVLSFYYLCLFRATCMDSEWLKNQFKKK